MKRSVWIPGLLCVLCGCMIWLLIENRALHAELKERSPTTAHGQDLSREQPKSPPMPAEAPVVARPSTPDERGASGGAPTKDAANFVAELWSNPEWRAARLNEAYLQVEVRHARFFQSLKGWSPERIEALKQQLASQSVALMHAATTFSSNGTSDKLGDEIGRVRAENEAQLQTTLTGEEYRSYQQVERMESSRAQVSEVANAMRSRGVSLDAGQEETVLRVFADTLHDAAGHAPNVAVSGLNPHQLTALKQQQLASFNETLMHNMSGVLNEAQLKSFMEAQLEQQGGR